MLALQRSAGNRAVAQLLAGRRSLARMAVDTVPMVAADVSAADADTYLTAWAARAQKPKVEATEDEVMTLVSTHLATHKDATDLAAARAAIDEVPAKLTPLLQGAPGHADEVAKIKQLVKTADDEEKTVTVTGWRLEVSTRNRAGLEKAVLASYRKRSAILSKAGGEARRLGQGLGLPALDDPTVAEFRGLEAIKARSRVERAPLDALLSKYVPRVDALIPGAHLQYRGSVARGVKSPSKHVQTAGGVALALFDDPGVRKAEPRKATTTPAPAVSYDVDANVEIPTKKFKELGLKTGPLKVGSGAHPVVQDLLKLQAEIDQDIRDNLWARMPNLEHGPFEFYLSDAGGKSEAQLSGGTPYPPYMLANAGFPNLAEKMPSAYSAELVNKLTEYINVMRYRSDKIRPLRAWDPYFADLYKHVKAKGPKAVFMPEVQVDLTAKTEYTQSPQPRSTADYTGPVDLVKELKYVLLGPATTAGAVKRGAWLEGTITGFMRPRGKPPIARVDLGAGQQAVCFDYGAATVGDWAIVEVLQPANAGWDAKVSWLGQ